MKFQDFWSTAMNPLCYAQAGLSEIPNVQYALVLYAQAYHETGGFKSRLFLDSNNLFAMKPAKKRKKFYKGESSGYPEGTFAKYESAMLSIADRINWDTYNGIYFTTAREYMDLVQGGNHNDLRYAQDKNYIMYWVQTLNIVCDQNNMARIWVRGYESVSTGTVTTNETTPTPDGANVTGETGSVMDWVKQNFIVVAIIGGLILFSGQMTKYMR